MLRYSSSQIANPIKRRKKSLAETEEIKHSDFILLIRMCVQAIIQLAN